jgi:hypothetical protein
MEMETPLPEIEKHGLPIGAFRQGKGLGMNITRMAIKLLFGHGSEDGLDNCRIDVIHDLLEKNACNGRSWSFLIRDFFVIVFMRSKRSLRLVAS